MYGHYEPFASQAHQLNVKLRALKPIPGLEQTPQYATPGSAGVDLMADGIEESVTIAPGGQFVFGTGIAIHIGNPNFVGYVFPRSGMGAKRGLVLGNLVGVIDSDYQGEIKVCLWNRGHEYQTVAPMDRIAQLVFMPVWQANFQRVEEFDAPTVRGVGGFGSTGTGHPAPNLRDVVSLQTDPSLLDKLYDLAGQARNPEKPVNVLSEPITYNPTSWQPESPQEQRKLVK